MYRQFLLILPAVFLLTSCKHKVPEPTPPNNTGTTTTTTTGSTTGTVVVPPPQKINLKDSVCYDEEIQPLLTRYCTDSACHNSVNRKAGIVLSSYAELIATTRGQLIVQSLLAGGPLHMPTDTMPQLSTNEIRLIQRWAAEGDQVGKDCCDTVSTTGMSFSQSILPGLQVSCIAACHYSQSPVFTNYDQVTAVKERIKCTLGPDAGKNNTCSEMPRAPYTMSACSKRKILKWIASGAPNN